MHLSRFPFILFLILNTFTFSFSPDMRGIEGAAAPQRAETAKILSDFINDPVIGEVLKQLPEADRVKFIQKIVLIDNRVVGLSVHELRTLKAHEIAAVLTFFGFFANPHAILADEHIQQRGTNDYTQDYMGYSCIPSVYHPKGECKKAGDSICSKDCGK